MTDSIRLNVLFKLNSNFSIGLSEFMERRLHQIAIPHTMLCTAEFLPAPVPQILGLGHAGQHLGLSWWQFHLVFFASMFAQ